MSILFLSSSGTLHEMALSMKIGTKSTLNRHQVSGLDSGIGTMLKLHRHQVGTKLGLSRDQVAVQSPTQLDKTTFYKQVTEQVAFLNSPIARYYLKALNPTLNTTLSDVFTLPFVRVRIDDSVDSKITNCISHTRKPTMRLAIHTYLTLIS